MNGKLLKHLFSTTLVLSSFSAIGACQNSEVAAQNDIARDRIWKGEKSHIVRYPWQEKLTAENLSSHPDTLQRIITMSNEERCRRLPSFIMKSSNTILFNRGTSRQFQEATSSFHTDSKGNFHYSQKIGRDDIEYILVDNTLYARYVNGPFRSKQALNQPVDLLRELSAQSIAESFTLWQKFMALSGQEMTSSNGRPAIRYNISLKSLPESAKPAPMDDSNTDANWRDYIWATDIKGNMTIDQESAVLLNAHLEVKADIFDREAQPTSLNYTFDTSLSDILKAGIVEVPTQSIEEYTVVKSFRGGKFRPQEDNTKQQP